MIDVHPTVCNICGGRVVFIENKQIYGKSRGSGYCYFCTKCHAYVGTHKNKPRKALGILANREMRLWKRRCHGVFDVLWQNNKERNFLYNKLAKALDIPAEDCHFGYFDVGMLQKAYDIVRGWRSDVNVFS